ncbi:hypothetical protein [uncultured Mitsuokella sp.]|uniref:hypothetical protein n=1 Tax=uncultured Mitsuokella sp. TaxID=453120 RepID=UPI002631DFA6|nr:hypothetical protein [uncultured Mitsuokella sp.]
MSRKISNEQEPWERQAGESSVAYEAFLLYRNMSHEPDGEKKKRRLASVAKKLGKSLALMERWSFTWDWVERARAYDNELQRISMDETREAVRKMLKDHMTMAQALQKKAMTALLRLDDQSLSARNILDYLAQGIEIERQARIREREMRFKDKSLDSGQFDTALNVTIKAKEAQDNGHSEGG